MNSQDQGGFSDEVHKFLLEQTPVIIFGWVGHRYRREELDEAVECALREKGVTAKGIAEWACSRAGRHFGDQVESNAYEYILSQGEALKADVLWLAKETGENYFESD